MIKIQSAEARNGLYKKPADGEDGRLMSQANHLVGSGCQVLSLEPEGRKAIRKKVRKQNREERQ